MQYVALVVSFLLGYLTWYWAASQDKRRARLAMVKEAAILPMAVPGPKALAELATIDSFAIEETRVTPVSSWPPKVAIEFLTPKCLFRGWLTPMQAHALSNDLLRAAASAKRKDERKEAG